MSTNYTDTLKRIKEAEEASNREVADKRKSLEAELVGIEQAADQSIAAAKAEAEAAVAKEAESARKSSQREADSLLASTKSKADEVASKRLGGNELRRIVDEVLFSEFKG